MKQKYYLFMAVILAALLVPIFMQYQIPSWATEPVTQEPATLDSLLSQLAEKLSGTNVVIITCDAKWNGMIKYQTIQGTEVQYIRGKGNKTINVQGDLLYITVEMWRVPPDAATYIGLEVKVNGKTMYKKDSGDSHSWKRP